MTLKTNVIIGETEMTVNYRYEPPTVGDNITPPTGARVEILAVELQNEDEVINQIILEHEN